MARPSTPVNVITGALGVGKTTSVRGAFQHRPSGERWAVLVNEFGEVGIDGPVLEEGGLAVREIAGGCICCTAGLELRVGLVRLLREVRPDRLLIEPSGVARPATVIDVLRSEGLAEAVDVRAVITLVHPRHFLDPVRRQRPGYDDQVLLADVLVGNHADACTDDELQEFVAAAGALDPPKLAVATTRFGQLQPEWLDLRAAPRQVQRRPHADPTEVRQTEGGGKVASGPDAEGCGWVWPAEAVFDRLLLEEALQELVHPCEALPQGALRVKGLMRTPRVVVEVHASPTEVRFRALDWRRDSRLEILAPPGSGARWAAVEERLAACRVDRGGR
jgi:G3E family GTPase